MDYGWGRAGAGVADRASSMPTIPRANTHLTTIALEERKRSADVISPESADRSEGSRISSVSNRLSDGATCARALASTRLNQAVFRRDDFLVTRSGLLEYRIA